MGISRERVSEGVYRDREREGLCRWGVYSS